MSKQKADADAFAGEGGCYIIENGVRRRVVEPTKDHPAGNAPRDASGQRLDRAEEQTPASDAASQAPAPAFIPPFPPKGKGIPTEI